ncbi:MAG: hypothetical protein ACYTFG_05400 [Planctomycetota bacterium]|jgi:hypothetical protein
MSVTADDHEAATGSGGEGLPVDFYVGVSLLCLAVFFFVLSAAGALGEGKGQAADGHGAGTKAGSHEGEKGGDGEGGEKSKTPSGKTARPGGKETTKPKGAEGGEPPLVQMREDAAPLDLAADKVVILPVVIEVDYIPGTDKHEASKALSLGVEKEFGHAGVSLLSIRADLDKAGFSALSRRLALGAYRTIQWCQSFDLAADTIVPVSKSLPSMVQKAVDLGEKKGSIDAGTRFVFAFTLDRMGIGEEGAQKRVRVIACLYDLTAKRIHSCTYYVKLIPKEAIPAKRCIDALPEEAFKRLMEKAAK